MRAACWAGPKKIEVRDVPDPQILNQHDAIVKISSTAICGSDLHPYNGLLPTMEPGDVLGHEFMGEVVEVGREVRSLKAGDRIVVPFPISCGSCWSCKHEMYSMCENSNPNAGLQEAALGHATGGIYGYSHMLGGFAGGQAEYARVPYADVDHIKIPEGVSDDQVLFLSDVYPTGYFAADNVEPQPGDVIAVWGCGPVGQFAIRSAFLLGAQRVIAIDRLEYRLKLARDGGAETVNYEEVDNLLEVLNEMTGGRGPDGCIDAVGLEAHQTGFAGTFDKAMQLVGMETDRPTVLRQVIMSVRNGGKVAIQGDYLGFGDKIPLGSLMNRYITVRTGQTPVQRYMPSLLETILNGDIDPSVIITHHMSLEEAPRGYQIFNDKVDSCEKIVMKP